MAYTDEIGKKPLKDPRNKLAEHSLPLPGVRDSRPLLVAAQTEPCDVVQLDAFANFSGGKRLETPRADPAFDSCVFRSLSKYLVQCVVASTPTSVYVLSIGFAAPDVRWHNAAQAYRAEADYLMMLYDEVRKSRACHRFRRALTLTRAVVDSRRRIAWASACLRI